MFKMLKKIRNKKLVLFTKKMNIINFPENPNKGGTPAKDINIKTIFIEIEFKLPIYLNSFKVLKYFVSNKKNIKKKFNNK
jgi:hypothetical protein